MKITLGLIQKREVFPSVTINEIKEIEYDNVNGFTFEYHEENETCTGQGEQCLVIWLNKSADRATFPISTFEYILTK